MFYKSSVSSMSTTNWFIDWKQGRMWIKSCQHSSKTIFSLESLTFFPADTLTCHTYRGEMITFNVMNSTRDCPSNANQKVYE